MIETLAKKEDFKKKNNLRRVIFILSFILIPTIHFLVFYVYVNFNSFLMAFTRKVGTNTIWGFGNFVQFFEEFGLASSELRLALKNTFKTFGVTLIMFPVGFLVAYFLYKKIAFFQIFRVLFFLPSVISSVIVNLIFLRVVGVSGIVAPIIKELLGLDYIPNLLGESQFANSTVLVNLIWLSFPGNMIIWSGAFSRIPDSIVESARLDGVNWVREAVSIIIPIVWPTFVLQFMLMFAGIFGATGNVFLLTKGQWGTQTLSNWMYMAVLQNPAGQSGNIFNFLSAVGVLITLSALTISIIIRKISSKIFTDIEY